MKTSLFRAQDRAQVIDHRRGAGVERSEPPVGRLSVAADYDVQGRHASSVPSEA